MWQLMFCFCEKNITFMIHSSYIFFFTSSYALLNMEQLITLFLSLNHFCQSILYISLYFFFLLARFSVLRTPHHNYTSGYL